VANSWKTQAPSPTRTSTGRPANSWPGCRRRPGPVRLYFTHGDYQPRNWVIDDGQVAVIDFERGQDRSWVSDLVRLQNKQFADHPEHKRAFMAGLGRTVEGEDAELLAIESLRRASAPSSGLMASATMTSRNTAAR
jgi:Ser/Thr protein kinase RdoA (MazF antagonist)